MIDYSASGEYSDLCRANASRNDKSNCFGKEAAAMLRVNGFELTICGR